MAGSVHKPQGYHRIANIMVGDPNAAIFRRFEDLQMVNLLSLQAELLSLRLQFRVRCRVDDTLTGGPEQYSKSFQKLHDSSSPQLELLRLIRAKLKEYISATMQLPRPKPRDYKEFCKWLADTKGGSGFQTDPSEVKTWIDETDDTVNLSSFLSLSPPIGEDDIFTRLLESFVLGIYDRVVGERSRAGKIIDEESGLRSYSDSKINNVSANITTVISSMLPVVTILVLYEIGNPYGRIGAAIGFTGVFAALLAIFSKARRIEVFAATAAFAAIEVVFIGGALKPSATSF